MGKILAIDYGTKKLGIALSDETQTIAYSDSPIFAKDDKSAISQITEITQKEEVEKIILGLPLGYEQKPTQMSEKIKKFKEKLQQSVNIDILLWNEVGTSKLALEGIMSSGLKSKSIDSESARIILQEYLDNN